MLKSLFVAAMLAVPCVSQAQPFKLPSGEPAYAFSYSTSITFTCIQAQFLPNATCATSGNTLTFANAGNTATVTYTGGSGSGVSRSVRGGNLDMGRFDLVYSGTSPFIWPAPGANISLFHWNIAVTQTSPSSSTIGHFGGGQARQSATQLQFQCGEGCSDFTTIAAGVIDGLPRPNFDEVTTRYVMTGQIGIVPEPSTYALLAAGLVGVGVVARRRRRVGV